MKLKIDRVALIEAMGRVMPVIPRNASINAVQSLYMAARDGGVSLRGTNLSTTITATVPAGKVSGEFGDAPVLVPAAKAFALVKALRGETVSMSLSENKLTMDAEGADYSFFTGNPGDFPTIPDFPGEECDAPISVLARGADLTGCAVFADEPRPHFRGVLLDARGGTLVFVGTDTRRLACYNSGIAFTIKRAALLPMELVGILRELWDGKDEDAPIRVRLADNAIQLTVAGLTIQSQLIEGVEQFPDYAKILTMPGDTAIEVDAADLNRAIKRLGVVDSDPWKVALETRADGLLLKSKSAETGEAEEKIAAKHNADGFKTWLSGKLMVDFLSRVSGAVKLAVTQPTRPVLMTANVVGYQYVCMPMKGDT